MGFLLQCISKSVGCLLTVYEEGAYAKASLHFNIQWGRYSACSEEAEIDRHK